LTALGEMSAGIAHELRNPMAVVTGYLALLAKKQEDAGKKVIQDIMAEINGMNRIIGDLLTFARPTPLNRTKVDLKDLLEGCIASLVQAKGKDPLVAVDLKLKASEMNLDEGLVRQAFSNLIQNAIESMPDGGNLSIGLRENSRETSVRIQDTGTGISQPTLKKIFLPFFTTKDKGVGMGLALAHKIITSHGGRISVESREGKGTTFLVTLPRG
ncbi:MAG TPA: ATP-binding protein, partial [Nitrospirota bacterium]|nr:ATP-binding protein [Nitrospirota bacterium]